MNPRLRPVPFPYPAGWRAEYRRLCARGASDYVARFEINSANRKARLLPMKSERCGAHAKSTGKPCMASARSNGRCRVHGSSRGPTTPEGRARALLNLKQFRQ